MGGRMHARARARSRTLVRAGLDAIETDGSLGVRVGGERLAADAVILAAPHEAATTASTNATPTTRTIRDKERCGLTTNPPSRYLDPNAS